MIALRIEDPHGRAQVLRVGIESTEMFCRLVESIATLTEMGWDVSLAGGQEVRQ